MASYPPARVALVCGRAEEALYEIARALGRSRNMLVLWGIPEFKFCAVRIEKG